MLSPKNKGVSPYTPLQAGYRSKKQSSAHLWLHVTSLSISFFQCYVTSSCFSFLSFISLLCYPSPASLSEHSLSVSLLVLLPATSFPLWCSDPPRVKEHHLDLGVCIFITSLHAWPFFFIVASIMVLIDRSIRGTRQGNIRYVPRIKHIVPLFMTNVALYCFL
jgi:hypothetical protein